MVTKTYNRDKNVLQAKLFSFLFPPKCYKILSQCHIYLLNFQSTGGMAHYAPAWLRVWLQVKNFVCFFTIPLFAQCN